MFPWSGKKKKKKAKSFFVFFLSFTWNFLTVSDIEDDFLGPFFWHAKYLGIVCVFEPRVVADEKRNSAIDFENH